MSVEQCFSHVRHATVNIYIIEKQRLEYNSLKYEYESEIPTKIYEREHLLLDFNRNDILRRQNIRRENAIPIQQFLKPKFLS